MNAGGTSGSGLVSDLGLRVASLALRVCLLVALVGIGCSGGPEPLHFSVSFAAGEDIAKGRRVVYRGVEIGKVEEVRFGEGGVLVRLAVEGKHRDAFYREMRFTIDRREGVKGWLGERQVTVTDVEGTRTPIAEGSEVAGYDPLKKDWQAQAEEAGKAALEAAKSGAAKLQEWARDFSSSPETKRFADSLRVYSEKASKAAKKQYDQLERDELPHLIQNAKRLKADLEKEGRAEDAKKFWDGFSRWLADTETAPAPPETPVEKPSGN